MEKLGLIRTGLEPVRETAGFEHCRFVPSAQLAAAPGRETAFAAAPAWPFAGLLFGAETSLFAGTGCAQDVSGWGLGVEGKRLGMNRGGLCSS